MGRIEEPESRHLYVQHLTPEQRQQMAEFEKGIEIRREEWLRFLGALPPEQKATPTKWVVRVLWCVLGVETLALLWVIIRALV